MSSSLQHRIRCREIENADVVGIVELLTRGFSVHRRRRKFWVCALTRLAEHSTPPGFPKYGYLLETGNTPVGVLLLIFSSMPVDGETRIRCNVSSWYVAPAFRSHAAMLVSRALKHKQVTYFNISPAPHTLPILEAQGYKRYCSGRFTAIAALAAGSCGAHVEAITHDMSPGLDLPLCEIELLLTHAEYGCLSLICRSEDGGSPFVFAIRRKFGVVRFAYLIYCRDLGDFVRFAGPLGRFLAWRGVPLVVLDANGPLDGLVGRYSDKHPKYFRGLDEPRLGDLAYSERALFGV